MKSIDIFYQVEGSARVEHLEFDGDATLAIVKLHIAKTHGLGGDDVLVFIEDEDDAPDEGKPVKHCGGPAGVKLHVHRCVRVVAAVTFNGEEVEHKFAPGATVARVKRWAAERKFGMTPDEAGEHVLQLSGTKERPSPGTHLGSLADHRKCRVAFDLVPDERVNGAEGGVA